MDIVDGTLRVKSPSFNDRGEIPLKHTGYSYDVSPAFKLYNLDPSGKSIAITLDDLDVVFTKSYNHWLIYNIPAIDIIPENVPYGADVETFGGAKQGVGYGKNRYRGPNIPFFLKKPHRYVFTFYVLDTFLNLNTDCRKNALLKAMEGHILQTAEISCFCKKHIVKKDKI